MAAIAYDLKYGDDYDWTAFSTDLIAKGVPRLNGWKQRTKQFSLVKQTSFIGEKRFARVVVWNGMSFSTVYIHTFDSCDKLYYTYSRKKRGTT